MNPLMQRQKSLIDRSGLGLLPGIGLAFALALLAMASLVLETWWVTIAVLLTLFAITAVITWVVVKLTADGDEQ